MWNPARFYSPSLKSNSLSFDLNLKIHRVFYDRVVWGQTGVKQCARHSQESKLILATKPRVALFKIVCLSSESLALLGFEFQVCLTLIFTPTETVIF